MRPGRPLAAASALAAAVGASLAASPALADGNLKFADDQQNVVSPTDTAFTVSGTGCTGQDAAVGVALYAPDGTMSTIVKATPDAEGNWSAELNIPDLIKSTGVEAKTDGTADGWSIGAGCVAYGEEKGQAQEAVAFDDTKVDGSYEISTDENGAQVIKVDIRGFSPNEEVTFTLVSKADPSKTYTVGKLKADAEGNVKGDLSVPSNVPDGEYLLTIEGARYGEGGSSTKTVVVKGGALDLVDNNDNSIADKRRHHRRPDRPRQRRQRERPGQHRRHPGGLRLQQAPGPDRCQRPALRRHCRGPRGHRWRRPHRASPQGLIASSQPDWEHVPPGRQHRHVLPPRRLHPPPQPSYGAHDRA